MPAKASGKNSKATTKKTLSKPAVKKVTKPVAKKATAAKTTKAAVKIKKVEKPTKKATVTKAKAAPATKLKAAAPAKKTSTVNKVTSAQKPIKKAAPTSAKVAPKKSPTTKTAPEKAAVNLNKKAAPKTTPLKKVAETGTKRASQTNVVKNKRMQPVEPNLSITSDTQPPSGAPEAKQPRFEKRAIVRAKPSDIPYGVNPYVMNEGESYMSEEQLNHFTEILTEWKHSLMEEVDRTMDHMKEAGNLPDPNDRASQEEGFALELRARDRERKLIKKIEETLQRIENNEYGYCEECGVEIGVRRLEARPTATLCIDCKTLDEIKEKQMSGA